jgi:hypothetical protein
VAGHFQTHLGRLEDVSLRSGLAKHHLTYSQSHPRASQYPDVDLLTNVSNPDLRDQVRLDVRSVRLLQEQEAVGQT